MAEQTVESTAALWVEPWAAHLAGSLAVNSVDGRVVHLAATMVENLVGCLADRKVDWSAALKAV